MVVAWARHGRSPLFTDFVQPEPVKITLSLLPAWAFPSQRWNLKVWAQFWTLNKSGSSSLKPWAFIPQAYNSARAFHLPPKIKNPSLSLCLAFLKFRLVKPGAYLRRAKIWPGLLSQRPGSFHFYFQFILKPCLICNSTSQSFQLWRLRIL